jgi:O-methyltransferase involved in polyketide biosynthesis
MLLARHRLIDELLAEAIEDGRVVTVIELACGMSPRGWRFVESYGDAIDYVEADLPAMANRKRERLERIGSLGAHHRVEAFDATTDDLAGLKERDGGVAVVTEGLLNYLPEDAVRGLWERIAALPAALYVSDLAVGGARDGLLATGFMAALSLFVQGLVHTHFDGTAGAEEALRDAGFERATIHEPAGARGLLQVLEAS